MPSDSSNLMMLNETADTPFTSQFTDGSITFHYNSITPIIGDISRYYVMSLPNPAIQKVIFHDPATIVYWDDGTKTVVKCNTERGDVFNKEHGLAMAVAKKYFGNKGSFNNEFAKWIGDEE